MKITINTKIYDSHRGDYTYGEISQLIKERWHRDLSESTISRCFTGKRKTYSPHALICDILKLDIKEIYKIEKEGI